MSWAFTNQTIPDQPIVYDSQTGCNIAVVSGQANARLIAAAPELLLALKKAEGFLADACDYGFQDLKPEYAVWKAVNEAIAKAEGTQGEGGAS